MLLDIERIEMLKSPVTAKMEDHGNGQDLTSRHLERSFSAFCSIADQFSGESRFKNFTELVDGKEYFSNFINGNHSGKFS